MITLRWREVLELLVGFWVVEVRCAAELAGGASPADLNATNLLIKPEEVINIDSSERLDHQF